MNTTKLNTFPCNCGHTKKFHRYAGPSIGDEWCDANGKFLIKGKINLNVCDCLKYVPSNLKYLEEKYNERKH